MRRTERQNGFTLIEVSLAIVIGVLVLAGAIYSYQQVRLSTANTAAKEKLMSLSVLIEEIDQRNYALPSLVQLRSAWRLRRPDDYNKSPWGGTFSDPETRFIDGNDVLPSMAEVGTGTGGTAFSTPTPTAADRGRIYYFRRDPNSGGNRFLWLHEFSVYGPDDTYGRYSHRMTGYGLGYVGPNAEQFYFVTGKGKTNAEGTGRLTAEGSIGD